MKKLLHERLREYGDHPVIIANELEGTWPCIGKATEIADEIERYYIPRPRFEDGEPVQFGDEVEDSNVWFVDVISIDQCGKYILAAPFGESTEWHTKNEPVKRPSPKVLDADGMEIKEGDTVWTLEGKDTGKVIEVGTIHSLVMLKSNAHWLNNDQFTHKEPDSFEKVLKDMEKFWSTSRFQLDTEKEFQELLERMGALLEGCIK